MAAQGPERELRLCEKCFLMLPEGAEFCPECGAPVDNDPAHLQGSDVAVYPELARANLLRMRGEYKQAEEVCIGILRRYPNQSTANVLLGDISAEKGDLEQAKQWYELALELTPDSEADKNKLASINKRLKERELAATAMNLDLPTKKPMTGLFIGAVLLLIASVATAAFLFGRQNPHPGLTKGGIVNRPITVGDPAPTTTSDTSGTTGGETPTTNEPKPAPPALSPLAQSIAAKSTRGSKISTAWMDPRTKRVFVTYAVADGDDERLVAADLGHAVHLAVENCPQATLRATKSGEDVYVADVMREAFVADSSRDWQAQDPNDPNAVLRAAADALLSREWRPGQEQPPNEASESPPAPPASGQ